MTVDQLISEYQKPYMWKQLGILMELAELWERHEIRAQQGDEISAYCLTWGIPWKPVHPPDWRNASSRAAQSRRIRRLAEQGLLERVREGNRTIALKLTPLGREITRCVNRLLAGVNS